MQVEVFWDVKTQHYNPKDLELIFTTMRTSRCSVVWRGKVQITQHCILPAP